MTRDDTTDETMTDAPVTDETSTQDCDAVFVSTPIGDGADAHRIVRKGPWTFTAMGAQGTEPLIRDVDAAERLGFGRPRDVRKLIERIWPENKRPHVRATVARTSMPRGGERETRVQEYWLTEAELLKLCARSSTPIAEGILDEMIAVYIAVRRGLVPMTAPAMNVAQVREIAAEVVAPLVERIELLTDRVRAVEAAQVPRADTVFCGPSEAARLRAGMRKVAHLRAATLRPSTTMSEAVFRAQQVVWRREWRRALGEVHRAVQDATAHEGLGKSWDFLPTNKLTEAWACVHQLEATAENALEQERRRRALARCDAQQPLPLGDKKDVN